MIVDRPGFILLQCWPLLLLLTWAAVEDLRVRKIWNWLTIAIVVIGVGRCITRFDAIGWKASLLGLLIGFVLPLAMFAIGAMGGGDVKLLAGVGAWVGPVPALMVFALASIVGAVFVLLHGLWSGRIIALLRNTALVAANLVNIRHLGVDHVRETGQSTRSLDKMLPYAVPIWIATVLVLFTQVMSLVSGR